MILRITANAAAAATLTVAAVGTITAASVSRTLAGPVVRYGEYGRTSAGRLRVKPGALTFPDDLTRVKLTKEHDRATSRGHATALEDDGNVLRMSFRVADGPEGDAALAEATDHSRDGFSYDLVDAVVQGDWITAGTVIAVGQVGIPAYTDSRIDTIAASTTTEKEHPVNEEQRARLAELRAKETLTQAEAAELAQLAALEDTSASTPPADQTPPAATQQVSASVPTVPGGVTPPTGPARTNPAGNALDRMIAGVCAGMANNRNVGEISAALVDVTHSQHTDVIEAPAWSGELWSGVQYTPKWDVFNTGDLTNWEGRGWRWVTKPEFDDYAGDKTEIPSNPLATEASSYEAARMAVGHDIDRKFYDFPNEAFLKSYAEACREDWARKIDAKKRAYALNNAVTTGEAGLTTMFQAVESVLAALDDRTGTDANAFIAVNRTDFRRLLDLSTLNAPAFLDLFNIDPKRFIRDKTVPVGTVVGGVKQAATVRTLPGSPIRVDAQAIANGGVDTGWFGYWAIEEHHTAGIASATFTAAP